MGFLVGFCALCALGRAALLVLKAEAGMRARRRSNFLSLRRKKVTKERATLLRVTPALAHRGNLRCSFAGRVAELAAR